MKSLLVFVFIAIQQFSCNADISGRNLNQVSENNHDVRTRSFGSQNKKEIEFIHVRKMEKKDGMRFKSEKNNVRDLQSVEELIQLFISMFQMYIKPFLIDPLLEFLESDDDDPTMKTNVPSSTPSVTLVPTNYLNCATQSDECVGNGYCDEATNTEETNFDGGDCIPSMRLIGDRYVGNFKYYGAVLGGNGFIYAIPNTSDRVLKIDPSTGDTTPVGDDLSHLGSDKFFGGVLGLDGFIYGIPSGQSQILKFDPITETSTLIETGLTSLGYSGGVVAENGDIYFVPLDADAIVKFVPSDLKNPIVELARFDNVPLKLLGGALGSDGNVYFIPFETVTRVIKINVANDEIELIGGIYMEDFKWSNAVLAKNGNIYACPSQDGQILEIDIKSQTTRRVGPFLGSEPFVYKWSALVEGVDGFLYGIPDMSDKILRFDPIDKNVTLIPLDVALEGGDFDSKWLNGVRANNGFIYGIPGSQTEVLEIGPLSYFN